MQSCCRTDGVKVRHSMWFRLYDNDPDPTRKCFGKIEREGTRKCIQVAT